MDGLLVISVLAVVLTIVTLVGHGIWLILAAIFGGGHAPLSETCPFCGRQASSSRRRCTWCERDRKSPVAQELNDLAAVGRQLQRFRSDGTLTPKVVDRMLAKLQGRRQRLLDPAAQKNPAAHATPLAARAAVKDGHTQPETAPPDLFTDEPIPMERPSAPAAVPVILFAEPLPGSESPANTPSSPPTELPPPLAEPAKPLLDLPDSTPYHVAEEEEKPVPLALPARPLLPAAATPRPPKPRPPAPPSQSWTEVLAAFMEQRNIRWGELIGGLLFVCSSVALVISLWHTLEKIPYSKFFIFVGISSAVFGVGLYAHYRWKLESTSRALLVIGTLLTPLNFVAMASMAKGDMTLEALVIEVVSLGIFTYLVGLAARVLVPDGRWPITAAIVGDSLAVLLIGRLVRVDSPAWWIVAAGAVPVALFAGAVGFYLYGRFDRSGTAKWRPLRLSDTQIGFIFTLLGITAFATVVALGLLVARSITPLDSSLAILPHDVAIALRRLSVLFSLTAVPVLASGLTVMRGSRRDKALAAYHLAGTIVALVAMLVGLTALGMAWPSPGWMIAVAVANSVVLVFAAFRWRMPILHAGVIACITLAYLTAFYLLIGQLTLGAEDPYGLHLLELMISARSGTAMAGLFLALAGVSEVLARLGRRRHSLIYFGGCGAVAVAGLLLVTVHGVQAGSADPLADSLRAAILYGVYGAGSLALTARWRRLGLSYLGLGLLTSAVLWGLWWQSAGHHIGPLWGAVLAIEALVMTVMAAVVHAAQAADLRKQELRRTAKSATTSAPELSGDRPAGRWYDPWKIVDEQHFATARPRSKGLSLADLYRIPLAHAGEAAAMLAAGLTVITTLRDWEPILKFHTPSPIIASAAIGAVFFLLAWLYRSPSRTWIASLVALAGGIHALNYNYFSFGDSIGPNWTIALLGHATLVLIAALCLDRLRAAQEAVRKVISDPLADTALLASGISALTLVFGRSAGSLWLACCFPWLAAVWLGLAWRRRSPALFAAHQTALVFAVLAVATVWLKHVGWLMPSTLPPVPNLLERIASVIHVVLQPRNLQVYGVALGLLSLAWVAVRVVAIRRVGPGSFSPAAPGPTTIGDAYLVGRHSLHSLVPPYGKPYGKTVDRWVRHAVVVLQWLLATVCLLAQVPRELSEVAASRALPAAISDAFGPTAWLLLGVLSVMLVATLWERWRTAELVAALLLAATLPSLVAGRFGADLAGATAWRWALAAAFILCSTAVWRRGDVAGWLRKIHAGPSAEELPHVDAARVARIVLLATMVLPVLAITFLAAMLQIGGTPPAGPLAQTFFATFGPTRSYLVPLVFVIAALVGHALRERSSGYAFSAGLVLEMAVILGYALDTTLEGRTFDSGFAVTLIQFFAISAAVWAIAWLVVRKWFDVWRESPRGASQLMNTQIGMAVLANTFAISAALVVLALIPIRHQVSSLVAGTPLGWIAFALPLAAIRLRGRLNPHAIGLAGLAAIGLLACTIRGLQPYWHLDVDAGWGYRTLMLGWSIYSLVIVAATWWIATRPTAASVVKSPHSLIGVAAVWVRVAGILAIMLALKAAFWHDEEQLWAAASIALASAAGATMAVWLRREGWAFAAALGVNAAASLVVWRFGRTLSPADYWLRLVEANIIASAAVAVTWLAARRRLYDAREMSLGDSPFLATQILLPVVGNDLLLALPVVWLMHSPAGLPAWMHELAAPQSLIGLAMTAAAAAWYLQQTKFARLLHVLGGFMVGAAVLAACYAGSIPRFQVADSWVAYHALTTAWAAAGLIVFGLAMAWGRLLGPRSLIESWTAAIGVMTVFMATLHAFHDPARPWWAAGAILAVSLSAGLVATLLQKPVHVYFSGALINLAGTIVWFAYSPGGANWPQWGMTDLAGLIEANALCLAIGSALWTIVDLLMQGLPAGDGLHSWFRQVAARLAAGLLMLVAAVSVAATVFELGRIPVERLAWIALAGVSTATALGLLDRRARFPLPTLYGLGQTAVAFGLLIRPLTPRMFCWLAVDDVAGYALLAAIVAWLLPRRGENWFSRRQAEFIVLAGMLGLWVTIDLGFDSCRLEILGWNLAGRMAATPGLLMLLLSAIIMAHVVVDIAGGAWRTRWQSAALGLAVMLLSGPGWAMLAADGPAPWLHRSVVLMAASAAVALLCGFGLKYVLPSGSDWNLRSRQAVPALAGLALGMLVMVLVREGSLFEMPGGAPLLPMANAVTMVTLLGLIAGSIAFAVTPGFDPLRLSDRGRQGYVYTAEALTAAIALQVWLTMPWLFKGYLIDYWMLIVMAVAFAGGGLGEWFHRRGQPVLAEPLAHTALALPLLPAVGFWIAPMLEVSGPWHLVGRAPLVWFLMAAFYGVLAVTRRSWQCLALSAVTGVIGLWVGLHLSGFEFLQNPQVFVIPVALAGLVAEYLNHDRLSESQSAAFRYLTLSAIYISSTADMFIAGLGNSWALPLVLMLLSVAGMLAGISLRVRSFLFLGLTFLVLDAMSMIWHAAHDLQYTWVWYVCGIALGAAILALFAVFEKRRNDVLAVVEGLKEWAG